MRAPPCCNVLAIAGLFACSHATSWSELRSEPGKFRAEFPGTPEESVKDQLTLPTRTEIHRIELKRGALGSLQVSYYDLPTPVTGDLAESAAKLECTSVLGAPWTVTAEHPQQIGTAPGYALTMTAPKSATLDEGGYEQDACFGAGQRIYHVLAVGPNTPEQQRDAARFLASFQLL